MKQTQSIRNKKGLILELYLQESHINAKIYLQYQYVMDHGRASVLVKRQYCQT